MDRKKHRQVVVAKKAEAEQRFLTHIRALVAEHGLYCHIPKQLTQRYLLTNETQITRGFGRVRLTDGQLLDPVLFLPKDVDPRLLWFPDFIYLFDNIYPTAYHEAHVDVFVGGQIAEVGESKYTLPFDIIAKARDRLGVAGTDPKPLEVSCSGRYGFGVEPNAVFADWGEVFGEDVDAKSGREPAEIHHLRVSKSFLLKPTVVLVEL